MQRLSEQTIDQIFTRQQAFFASGKTRGITFRKSALIKLRDTINASRALIYQALAADLGKTPDEVDAAEIRPVMVEIETALAGINDWSTPREAPVPGFLQPSACLIGHEPHGVCYIIGPFNYPLNLSLCPLVGAIAGGNTAIIKPSEATPQASAAIGEIINQAFPADYLCVIEGARRENELLLALPFDFIFFTGSPAVGKVVMRAAAEHLTPVLLELGGKCPLIVLADADLKLVVQQILASKFFNSGQTCVAPDYLLVDERVKAALLEKLSAAIAASYPPGTSTGKLVSEEKVARLEYLLGRSQGQVLLGGQGNIQRREFSPTLVDEVSWEDALMQEELFAPVLPVLSFREESLLATRINHYHPKPLAVYVFTRDRLRGQGIIDAIPSGDAQLNGVMNHVFSPYLPFGGTGASGSGEYHGYYSFTAFTHRKSLRMTA